MEESNVPNLDCFASAGELWELWQQWGGSSVRPLRQAREMFPGRRKGIVRAMQDLRAYAANKATAMALRSDGEIQNALTYEGICERIYDDLPVWARW